MVKVLQQKTWIDDRKFLKSCVRAMAKQGNINYPAYGTCDRLHVERSEGSIWTTRVPSRHKRREMMAIAGIQMACKKQTAIRCKLLIMQKGTRTTRCKHWQFAERVVWAHQQCFLRWNGDNRHGCPPLHLETSVCQHASCTNTSEYAQVCHTWWR